MPIGVLIGILVARGLGVEGRGIYAVIITYAAFISNIGSLGFGNGSVYFINQKNKDYKTVLSTQLIFAVFWSLILTGGIWILSYLFPSLFKSIPQPLMVSMMLIVVISIFSSMLMPVFLIKLDIIRRNVVQLVVQLAQLGFTFAAFVFYKSNITPFIGIYIGSLLIPVVYVFIHYRIYQCFEAKFDFKLFKVLLDYALKTFMGNFAFFLNLQVDVLLLNYFKGSYEVGVYSIAVQMTNYLLIIPNALGPVFYSHWCKDENTKIESVLSTSRLITFSVIFMGIFLTAFGKYVLLVLFGRDFLVSVMPMTILIPGVILMTLNYTLFNWFSSKGKPEIPTKILSYGLLINVILNCISIPILGSVGAATSSLISYSFSSFLSIVYFSKLENISFRKVLGSIFDIQKYFYEIFKVLNIRFKISK